MPQDSFSIGDSPAPARAPCVGHAIRNAECILLRKCVRRKSGNFVPAGRENRAESGLELTGASSSC
jgi:hypothetical protein